MKMFMKKLSLQTTQVSNKIMKINLIIRFLTEEN